MQDSHWRVILFGVAAFFVISAGLAAKQIFFEAKSYPPGVKQADAVAAIVLKEGTAVPDLSAESVFSVYVDGAGKSKVLFEKNSKMKTPIASLAKIMTAFAVLGNYPQDRNITISKSAVIEPEEAGQLKPGEVFSVAQLLYPMLIESSNDAAAALAEDAGRAKFIGLMNIIANSAGLQDTFYANATGLDQGDLTFLAEVKLREAASSAGGLTSEGREGETFGGTGFSTAEDQATLARYIADKQPEIFRILSIDEMDLYNADGEFHHRMETTNELLRDNEWGRKILGGKTGETPKAKQALLLIVAPPEGRSGYVVNIVLKSDQRFQDMKTLADWVYNSYVWSAD